MLSEDYKMTQSREDDITLIVLGITFIVAFIDLSQAFISFTVLIFLLVTWGIVRLRRRPLPLQVQKTRLYYLVHLRIIRYYSLLSIIFLNILLLVGLSSEMYRIVVIFNFVQLFILGLVELIGNIVASDFLIAVPQLDGEDQQEMEKQYLSLLFGIKFYVWIVISSVLVIISFIPIFGTLLATKSWLLIMLQTFALIFSLSIVFYNHKQTINSTTIYDTDQIMKAVDYYNALNYRDYSYEIINEKLAMNPSNLTLLLRKSIMSVEDNSFEDVINVTDTMIEEMTEQGITAPALQGKVYFIRALSFSGLKEYQRSYDEATKALNFTPDNQPLRKLRRDVRKLINEKN